MYSGIEINEGKLLANNIVFTLILLFIIAIGVFALFVYRDQENVKTKKDSSNLNQKLRPIPTPKSNLKN